MLGILLDFAGTGGGTEELPLKESAICAEVSTLR